jgi:hypothetical protein
MHSALGFVLVGLEAGECGYKGLLPLILDIYDYSLRDVCFDPHPRCGGCNSRVAELLLNDSYCVCMCTKWP